MLYKIGKETKDTVTGECYGDSEYAIVEDTKESLIEKYEDEGYYVMKDYGDTLVMTKEDFNRNLVTKLYIQEY